MRLLLALILLPNLLFADDEPGGWVEPGGYDPVAEAAKQKAIEAKQKEAEQQKLKAEKIAKDKARKRALEKKLAAEKEALLPENMARVSNDDACINAGKELRARKGEAWANELAKRGLKFEANNAFRETINIGSTECTVYAALGNPQKIHRSVGKNYIKKQFVYPSAYIYTENGIVSSWQD